MTSAIGVSSRWGPGAAGIGRDLHAPPDGGRRRPPGRFRRLPRRRARRRPAARRGPSTNAATAVRPVLSPSSTARRLVGLTGHPGDGRAERPALIRAVEVAASHRHRVQSPRAPPSERARPPAVQPGPVPDLGQRRTLEKARVHATRAVRRQRVVDRRGFHPPCHLRSQAVDRLDGVDPPDVAEGVRVSTVRGHLRPAPA